MYIVVIEDSKIVRSALVQLFGKHKDVEDTDAFSNAQDAINSIKKKTPDVLVTDWDLGKGESGVAVARVVRELSSSAKIVFITGRSLKQLKSNTAQLNIQHYLVKPFMLEELRQAVFSD